MGGFDSIRIQLIRVAVFQAAIVSLYAFALYWLFAHWSRRKATNAIERAFRTWKVGIPLLLLAALGLGCIAYGFWVEPYRLTTTTYTIETPKLPQGSRVRIVQLSDIHVRRFGQREDALQRLVTRLSPDLIVHTGDFFGRSADANAAVLALLKSWKVPQYAVRGNLDGLGQLDRVLREAGVVRLRGDAVPVTVRGANLTLAGIGENRSDDIPSLLKKVPEDTFNVLLFHRPEGFPEMWGSSEDLMLAGHTHGGQVCLPGYGALITMDKYDKRWESGYFKEDGARLIVSRGIGCEPMAPEVRFWCPPEVIVIDLVGANPWEQTKLTKIARN